MLKCSKRKFQIVQGDVSRALVKREEQQRKQRAKLELVAVSLRHELGEECELVKKVHANLDEVCSCYGLAAFCFFVLPQE